MTNYVISLSNAASRRDHISVEFNRQQVDFELFDAITPEQNSAIIDLLGLKFEQSELTTGEIACLLSHVSLWKLAIDQNLKFITIFEDDIYLGKETHNLLMNYDWIPDDVNIIKLEVFSSRVKISSDKMTLPSTERGLYRLHGIHLGCAGYILSREACIDLFTYVQNLNELIAVDHIVFEFFELSTQYIPYQLNPGLCIQSDILNSKQNKVFQSSLEKSRRERMNIKVAVIKNKLTIQQKIIREWRRLIAQFIYYIEHKKIKFK